MFVAQVLVNGTTNDSSGSSPKVWWWICGIFSTISLLMGSLDDTYTSDISQECKADGDLTDDDCDQMVEESSTGFEIGPSCD